METLKIIITALCVSLIFYGVLILLVPEGNMKKTFKMLAGVAVIASVTVSLRGITGIMTDAYDFDPDAADGGFASELLNTVEKNRREQISLAVSDLVTQTLESDGIVNCEVTTFTDISDKGDISISEVHIVCPKGYKDAAAASAGKLGLKVSAVEREERTDEY